MDFSRYPPGVERMVKNTYKQTLAAEDHFKNSMTTRTLEWERGLLFVRTFPSNRIRTDVDYSYGFRMRILCASPANETIYVQFIQCPCRKMDIPSRGTSQAAARIRTFLYMTCFCCYTMKNSRCVFWRILVGHYTLLRYVFVSAWPNLAIIYEGYETNNGRARGGNLVFSRRPLRVGPERAWATL